MPENSFVVSNPHFEDLLGLGFTEDEAVMLICLKTHARERTEYLEWVKEQRRLDFLHWLVEHKRITEDTAH